MVDTRNKAFESMGNEAQQELNTVESTIEGALQKLEVHYYSSVYR
jgi:hypothetical protein